MRGNQLVISPSEAALLFDEIYVVKEKDFSIQINYLGSNHPKVLHAVYVSESEFNNQIDFIYSVTEKGLKINRNDVAIVNLMSQPAIKMQNLADYFSCNYIIFWGCQDWLKQQNLPIQNYSNILHGGIHCIVVEPSDVIAADSSRKILLWKILQMVFFVK